MNRSLYLHTQENNWIFFLLAWSSLFCDCYLFGWQQLDLLCWLQVSCKYSKRVFCVFIRICVENNYWFPFLLFVMSHFAILIMAQTVVSQFSSVFKIRHTNEYNVYVWCIVSRTTGFWLDIFRYFHFLLPLHISFADFVCFFPFAIEPKR